MRMVNPPHPGEILKEDYLPSLNLSVTKAAKALGVSRKTLSEIVNAKAGITPDMAIRLERAFGGLQAETWLGLQNQYDLRRTEKRLKKVRVKRITMPKNYAEERV